MRKLLQLDKNWIRHKGKRIVDNRNDILRIFLPVPMSSVSRLTSTLYVVQLTTNTRSDID